MDRIDGGGSGARDVSHERSGEPDPKWWAESLQRGLDGARVEQEELAAWDQSHATISTELPGRAASPDAAAGRLDRVPPDQSVILTVQAGRKRYAHCWHCLWSGAMVSRIWPFFPR